MIGNFVALYRARADSTLAKRLASEMVVDGVVGRIGWPLTIAKLWMTAGITASAVLILLFLTLGTLTHWALALPALPFGGIIYGITKVWRGINKGVDHVTRLAKTELGNKAASLSIKSASPEETSNAAQ